MLLAQAAPPLLSPQLIGLIVGGMFTLAIGIVLFLLNRVAKKGDDVDQRLRAIEEAQAEARGAERARAGITTPNRRR
jgi:hypothetical protein